jgi:hypothetical protein
VLTHLSQRYPEPDEHLAEAAEVFPDVVVAEDLDRVPAAALTRNRLPTVRRRSTAAG